MTVQILAEPVVMDFRTKIAIGGRDQLTSKLPQRRIADRGKTPRLDGT